MGVGRAVAMVEVREVGTVEEMVEAMVEAARAAEETVGVATAEVETAAAAMEAEAMEVVTVGVGTVADSEVEGSEVAAMGARRMCASGCACAPP